MTGMATWFVYGAGLALLLGLAARAAEAAVREMGGQARWLWLGAMALTLAVPLLSWLGLRGWSSPVPALPEAVGLSLPEVGVAMESGRGSADPLPLLLGVWTALSIAIAVRLAVSFERLRRMQAGWRPERLGGVPVMVTKNLGPAVFGLRRACILIPEWALGLEERLRSMLLLHEREHVRRHDPVVLGAGLAMVILMPWNPVLWWQLHRLRMAIEMDCDARVLREVADPRGYGALLLEVGRRRGSLIGVLAFSEPVSFLERRIRQFTRTAGRNAGRRALGLSVMAIALLALAVCTRDPMSSSPQPVTEELAVSTAAPEFTPYSVAPSLRNPAQIQALLQRTYPPLLRDAGIGGTAQVWLFVDGSGEVQRVQLAETSGHDPLDAAALHVVSAMQFVPAANRGQPVAVWMQVPVTFAARGDADEAETASEPRRELSTERLPNQPPGQLQPGAGPTFTPMTVRPGLRNTQEVQEALRREYPPMLRDAGIGGRALIWFHIDANGEIADLRMNQSSGYPDLDDAALRVARGMRFTPALNRDRRVAVWVAIPITFSSR